jgi:hypothetical protein
MNMVRVCNWNDQISYKSGIKTSNVRLNINLVSILFFNLILMDINLGLGMFSWQLEKLQTLNNAP